MKQRGDVWWVNFDPSVGQEVKKKRPAIVVSNNTSITEDELVEVKRVIKLQLGLE